MGSLAWIASGVGLFLLWAGYLGENPAKVLTAILKDEEYQRTGSGYAPQHSDAPGTVVGNAPPAAAPSAGTGAVQFAHPTPGAPAPSGAQKFGAPRPYGGHTGSDFEIPNGTPVKATASGTVSFAGPRGGYGNFIIVEHSQVFKSQYAHLQSFGVRQGDVVTQGQQIALSNNTGRSSGPHLHFMILRNGVAVDPMGLLQ